ncbi:MAG: hypothetical protein LBQ77_08575 [Treponema sp.]|nr:hypothetical protein [Treponema sp.]
MKRALIVMILVSVFLGCASVTADGGITEIKNDSNSRVEVQLNGTVKEIDESGKIVKTKNPRYALEPGESRIIHGTVPPKTKWVYTFDSAATNDLSVARSSTSPLTITTIPSVGNTLSGKQGTLLLKNNTTSTIEIQIKAVIQQEDGTTQENPLYSLESGETLEVLLIQ